MAADAGSGAGQIAATLPEGEISKGLKGRVSGELSLRKLQIFWAVAHSASLTKAAKLLGVTQPSLSQQLSSLEAAIGGQLFERRSNTLFLTELGTALLARTEHVLRAMQDLEDSLPAAGGGVRQSLRIAGATSVLRALLPQVLHRLQTVLPDMEFDLHEGAPNEVLDLLYARRVTLGILAATAVAEAGSGFLQVPVMEDPYVLVVPEALDLSRVRDVGRDLGADQQRVLNSTIQFEFGTLHSRRVQDWYNAALPANHLTARVRSFELMVEMVRGGAGVGIAPALSVSAQPGRPPGLRLYRVGLEERRIVAMVPSQYRRQPPHAAFLAALQDLGASHQGPEIGPVPPFVAALPDGGPDR